MVQYSLWASGIAVELAAGDATVLKLGVGVWGTVPRLPVEGGGAAPESDTGAGGTASEVGVDGAADESEAGAGGGRTATFELPLSEFSSPSLQFPLSSHSATAPPSSSPP